MAKKKAKVNNLVMMPFTSNNVGTLNSMKTMAEGLMYNYLLRTCRGNIGRVWAFISDVKSMEANGTREYNEYVRVIKSMGYSHAIDFEIIITGDTGELIDDL